MNTATEHRNRRVLIIDDNFEIHHDFRKILAPDELTRYADSEALLFGSSIKTVAAPQFDLDSAYQGQEGFALVKKALEEGRPHAMAFVDVRMPPGWDGVETTRRIWEIDPDLQVVTRIIPGARCSKRSEIVAGCSFSRSRLMPWKCSNWRRR
jgi:CheY-like chemotaxis protein